MNVEEATAILKAKLAHSTRDYRPEDEALDVLCKAAQAPRGAPPIESRKTKGALFGVFSAAMFASFLLLLVVDHVPVNGTATDENWVLGNAAIVVMAAPAALDLFPLPGEDGVRPAPATPLDRSAPASAVIALLSDWTEEDLRSGAMTFVTRPAHSELTPARTIALQKAMDLDRSKGISEGAASGASLIRAVGSMRATGGWLSDETLSVRLNSYLRQRLVESTAKQQIVANPIIRIRCGLLGPANYCSWPTVDADLAAVYDELVAAKNWNPSR